ncbi:uncharacterized [Tachysurus ichikawai]
MLIRLPLVGPDRSEKLKTCTLTGPPTPKNKGLGRGKGYLRFLGGEGDREASDEIMSHVQGRRSTGRGLRRPAGDKLEDLFLMQTWQAATNCR